MTRKRVQAQCFSNGHDCPREIAASFQGHGQSSQGTIMLRKQLKAKAGSLRTLSLLACFVMKGRKLVMRFSKAGIELTGQIKGCKCGRGAVASHVGHTLPHDPRDNGRGVCHPCCP